MTDEQTKSAFFQALEKINAVTKISDKGYKFLIHPSKFFKLALNNKGELSIITDIKRNATWISTEKGYNERLEQNKLLAEVKKEGFFKDMDTYNKSLKDVSKAKDEGIIKEDNVFF